MSRLPTGTVTFLFTDIEGSTKLAREYPDTWETARARHHVILRGAIESNNGYVFQIIGDALCAAFHKTGDAVKAALKSQQDLQNEKWGEAEIRVRMGIHTGEAEAQGNEYHGYLTLSLVQRLMSAGHGGQVLVSGTAENLLRDQVPKDVTLRDLGKHNFKDVPQPVRIFQVTSGDLQKDFPALHTFDLLPNNLPTQITSFVGREKELADARKLLHDAHMLTLIGPGGTGKTRLSIQAAQESLDQYPDGVWLVELAPVLDPLLVPRTTAIAIGLREEPQRPVIDMLCDYLREKKMLIILDNCEHLVDACAQMVDRLLHASAHTRILASSREALGIAGEVTYRVPSLGLPDMSHLPSFESLSQYEAVELFIDRATSAVSTFSVTNDNAPSLAQICHRLDGIPLAIELAAAKIRVLSVEQIARRLDDRFRLLTGGSRTALERHQTLRAAIDWSYNLLPPSEQILFRSLSIFVGGWTLEAAESVCSDPATLRQAQADAALPEEQVAPLRPSSSVVRSDDVLNLMEQLINKSLVIKEEAEHESRYHMLETMRQYANEKLVESGESDALRDRHLEYFLTLAETSDAHLRKPEQIEWLRRVETEIENLRAALDWAMGKESAEPTLRLAGALGHFWDMRSYWLEGAKWLDQAVSKEWNEKVESEKAARAKALYRRADIAEALDELDVRRTSAVAALTLCEEIQDPWGIAYSRALVASHSQRLGSMQESTSSLEQSLKEFQGLGDPWGESWVLRWLGGVLKETGTREEFVENRQCVIACARASGDRVRIADSLMGLVWTVLMQFGQWEEAERILLEAERLYAEIESANGINQVRSCRAQIFFACGSLEQAKHEAKLFVEYCVRVGERNQRAGTLVVLGLIAEAENDLSSAVEYVGKTLELEREMEIPMFVALSLILRGLLEYRQGNGEAVKQDVREGIQVVQRGEVGPLWVVHIFCYLGGLFVERKSQIAVQLLAYSELLSQSFPMPRDPIFDQPYFDRFMVQARAKLSEAEFTSAWEVGLKMSQDEALDLVLKTVEEI